MHCSQAALAALGVMNGISLDTMLDYVSGATSTTMCFIIPFVCYYKFIEKDADKKREKIVYLGLIAVFVIFQVGKIVSFFF